MNAPPGFDPYKLFAVLDRERVSYVVVGGLARVVHGSAEVTKGLDIVPSLHSDNARRLTRALEALGADPVVLAGPLEAREPALVHTAVGDLRVVPEPWGTRGYDDLRIRASRENLGQGARPAVASAVDCVRMLDASGREADADRLVRLRRAMELERELVPRRGLSIER